MVRFGSVSVFMHKIHLSVRLTETKKCLGSVLKNLTEPSPPLASPSCFWFGYEGCGMVSVGLRYLHN